MPCCARSLRLIGPDDRAAVMVAIARSEHRLASGCVARIAHMTPQSFRVLPFMVTDAPADEMRLARHLGRARLGMALNRVPPVHRRSARSGNADGGA